MGDRALVGADFARKSAVELIAFLAMTERRRLPKEQIMEALWPDLSPAAGTNQLNKAASYARNAIEDKRAVVVENGVMSLFPDATVRIDARDVLDVDTSDEQAVDTVLGHSTGRLLPDWPYAEWTIEPRRTLHLFVLGLLRQRSRWHEILRIDSLDEGAHLALMSAAMERGDRDDVLRRFEHLEQLLEVELGVGPSVGALALRDEALAADPTKPASPPISGLRSFMLVGFDGGSEGDAVRAVLGGTIFEDDNEHIWATFTTASEAIGAAIECQRRAGDATAIRIGLDLDEAERRGDQWHGPVLTRLGEMAKAAWGGQIVCTSVIAEMAAANQSHSVRSLDLGVYRLPGVTPVRLHRLVSDQIANRESPLRALRGGSRHELVVPEQLFGREDEWHQLLDHLTTHRHVTIVGPGGCGKTHLAKHLAAHLHSTLAGGAWICELGSISEGSAVAQVVLSTLGGHVHSDASVLESIARTIGDAEVVLVIDNCEHVVDEVNALCQELLAVAPSARLLATSRQPIGGTAEQVFTLGQLTRDAAVELFVAEAKRQGVTVAPGLAAVDRICHRLDDLPLAIRLAAARSSALEVDAIESLLEDRFTHLTAPDHAALAHHQTLRAATSWSFDALPPEAQQVLGAVSVFANRFTLEAATGVCAHHGQEDQFVGWLQELVRRSLVVRPGRDGSYRLLESVRVFARETQGFSPDTAARYVKFFATRAQTLAALIEADSRAAVSRFDDDWEDLRQALVTANESGLTAEVHRLLAGCTNLSILTQKAEVFDWCESFLVRPESNAISPVHAEALLAWSYWLAVRGDPIEARHLAELARHAMPGGAAPQWVLGFVDYSVGAEGHGREWFAAAGYGRDPDAVISQIGGLVQLAVLDSIAGADIADIVGRLEVLTLGGGAYQESSFLLAQAMHQAMADPTTALETFEACIALAESCDLLIISATARSARAFTLLLSRPLPEAYVGLQSALEWSASRGMWSWTIADFPTAAGALELGGQPRVATLLLSARSATRFDVGIGSELVGLQIEGLRTNHPDDFDQWWEQGQLLSPDNATRLALSSLASSAQPAL